MSIRSLTGLAAWILMCSSASAYTQSHIEAPAYNPNTPPQYAVFSMAEGWTAMRWGNAYSGFTMSQCKISIRLQPPEGMSGPAYYFELEGDSNLYTCFGVRYQYRLEDMAKALSPVLQNVRVPYTRSGPALPQHRRCSGVLSTHWVTTPNVAGWFIADGECTSVPAVVSCEVSVPTVIEHKPVSTGDIRSSARGVANVRCTGKASVGLSSPGGIALYNGKEKVDSRLSVQRGGSTAVNVIADPSIDVDLLSDIDTTQPHAGVYSGAGVLVASWD